MVLFLTAAVRLGRLPIMVDIVNLPLCGRAFARWADWMGGAGMMQMLAPAAWAVCACGAA